MRLFNLLTTISSLMAGAVSQHILTRSSGTNKVWKPPNMLLYPNGDTIPVLKNNIASDATLYTKIVKNVDLYHRVYRGIPPKPEEIKIIYERHRPTPTEGGALHSNYNNNNVVNISKKEKEIVQEKDEKRNAIPFKSSNSNSLPNIIGRKTAEHLATRQDSHIREPRINKMPNGGGLAIQRKNYIVYKPKGKEQGTKSTKDNNFEALWQRILSAGRTFPIRIYSLNKHFAKSLRKKTGTFDSIEELIPFRLVRNPMFIAFDKKKGAKRKVKFSSWPGKKFPPIIGPMWTPTKQAMNEWKLRKTF